MIGQAFLLEELAKFAPIITREGWQKDGNGTSQIRQHLGLVKEKQDKAKQVPEAHAVDAVALASSWFIQYQSFHTANTHGHEWVGTVSITSALFKVISKPRITRRRLFDAVPAKGNVFERYGGSTTPFSARKGDLILYLTKSKGVIKQVIGYCSGYTGNKLSLSDASWSRLGRFANSKCRILARNTGLVISGTLSPTQLLSYPPYNQIRN